MVQIFVCYSAWIYSLINSILAYSYIKRKIFVSVTLTLFSQWFLIDQYSISYDIVDLNVIHVDEYLVSVLKISSDNIIKVCIHNYCFMSTTQLKGTGIV